jgi:hypothetical protein
MNQVFLIQKKKPQMIYGPYRNVTAVSVNKPINISVIENPKMFYSRRRAMFREGNTNIRIDVFRSEVKTVSNFLGGRLPL